MFFHGTLEVGKSHGFYFCGKRRMVLSHEIQFLEDFLFPIGQFATFLMTVVKKRNTGRLLTRVEKFFFFQAHEDLSKRLKSKQPMIISDGAQFYLYHNQIITEMNEPEDALIVLIAYHYLTDLDYPSNLEYGLCFVQHLIFQDITCPKDQLLSVETLMENYISFKNNWCIDCIQTRFMF